MVSLQVHTLCCQLRHWNYCPVIKIKILLGDIYPVDNAVSDSSVPAFRSRHWMVTKGRQMQTSLWPNPSSAHLFLQLYGLAVSSINPRNTQSLALVCFQAGLQLWEGSFHSLSHRENLPEALGDEGWRGQQLPDIVVLCWLDCVQAVC